MAAPYRSGDGQGQADRQTCKQAGRQTAKRSACHPGKHADARSGKRAALPTGGRSCSQRCARPSPRWAVVCRTGAARQTRSGRRSRSRDRRNRIARWHGRLLGTAPLSGPVPRRATAPAGRDPSRVRLGLGRFGRGGAPFHVDAPRIEGVGHRLGGTPKRIARKSRNRR